MTKPSSVYWTHLTLVGVLVGCTLAVSTGSAQQSDDGRSRPPSPSIKVQQIRRNVFMLVGDGANITLQTELPSTEESYDSPYGVTLGSL